MKFLNDSSPNNFQLVILKNTFPNFIFIDLISLFIKKDAGEALEVLKSNIDKESTLLKINLKEKHKLFEKLLLFIIKSSINLEFKVISFFLSISYLIKNENIQLSFFKQIKNKLFNNLDTTRQLNKFNYSFEVFEKNNFFITEDFKILKKQPLNFNSKFTINHCSIYKN
jgi:hypothetical protein